MRNLLIALLLISWQQSQAQLPDYYVYLISGDVTVANPGKAPAVVRHKQLIYKKDILILKKGAEVTLVDKDAGFFVINTVGKNTVSSLVGKTASKPNDGITTKYLKLLFHELLDPNQDFEKLKKENIAGVWGGVSRGDECGNRVFPINGLQTSASSIVFKWHATSPSSNYSFVLYDAGGNELAKMNTKDTTLPVDCKEKLGGKEGKYFWRVTSTDGICEDEVPIYFNVLTIENEQKLVNQLVTADVQNLDMQLQQIDKLEKNAFIQAASARYSSLVKASPGNKALVKSYVLFLLKYGFDDEATAAWKF